MAAKKKPSRKMPEPSKPTLSGPGKSKVSQRLGLKARVNASKRGTLVGPTYVEDLSNTMTGVTKSSSTVKSKRGNYYSITESKKIVSLGRDGKTKTSIAQITNHPDSKKKKKK